MSCSNLSLHLATMIHCITVSMHWAGAKYVELAAKSVTCGMLNKIMTLAQPPQGVEPYSCWRVLDTARQPLTNQAAIAVPSTKQHSLHAQGTRHRSSMASCKCYFTSSCVASTY